MIRTENEKDKNYIFDVFRNNAILHKVILKVFLLIFKCTNKEYILIRL